MSRSAPSRGTLAPADFQIFARMVLGPDWRRELATYVDLDVVMIDDWAEGRAPVPYVIVKTLAALARFRGEDLLRMSDRLTTDLEAWLGEL
jgi:hypothetical protein